MTTTPFPNVRARLRRTRTAPGTAPVQTVMTMYLRDSRFRVVDESGRRFSKIVADVSAPRGFGTTPTTMEEFMDALDADEREAGRPATQLRGDLNSGQASVAEAGREPWPVHLDQLIPVAGQILFDAQASGPAEDSAAQSVLGRPCLEYRSVLTGQENGYTYRSSVRLLMSGLFVLTREIVDEEHAELTARTEVVELDEEAVTDDDL